MPVNTTPPHSAIERSPRLSALPTYVFAWLDELKQAARAQGRDFVDLGMGNPDMPTPPAIVQAIAEAYADASTHGYPPFRGTPRFREAVARYMHRRFGAEVDAEREVLCLSGAKEGIAQLTIAYTDERSVSLVPDVYYPVHARATMLAGGKVHFLPLRSADAFLPRLSEVPEEVLADARLLILNYPHNPTGAVATRALLEEAVALCARHGIILIYDAAYAELAFGERSPSVMEIPGAKDVAVELHSFSKSFSMAGSRIGFAVGSATILDALHAVRTNMGYGTPSAIQAGAAFALDHAEELVPPIVERYRQRRTVLVNGFRSLGWPVAREPGGTMFCWLRVPRGFTSQQWTEHLLDTAGVVVTPGNAFGPGGEGFFRVSMIREPEELEAVFQGMRDAGVRWVDPRTAPREG